jgi:hypothetical protein
MARQTRLPGKRGFALPPQSTRCRHRSRPVSISFFLPPDRAFCCQSSCFPAYGHRPPCTRFFFKISTCFYLILLTRISLTRVVQGRMPSAGRGETCAGGTAKPPGSRVIAEWNAKHHDLLDGPTSHLLRLAGGRLRSAHRGVCRALVFLAAPPEISLAEKR